MKAFQSNIYQINLFEIAFFMLLLCSSCANTKKTSNLQQFEIKTQEKTWSFEVLNVSFFKNGEPILEAKTKEDWIKAGREGKPAWTYYNNNTNSGKIYNWYAVNSSFGLAPEGWHIPTDLEWSTIVTQFGGEMIAAKNMSDASEGKFYPVGIIDSTGHFNSKVGAWWSTTSLNKNNALRRFGYPNKDFLLRSYNNKMEGLSVICLKD